MTAGLLLLCHVTRVIIKCSGLFFSFPRFPHLTSPHNIPTNQASLHNNNDKKNKTLPTPTMATDTRHNTKETDSSKAKLKKKDDAMENFITTNGTTVEAKPPDLCFQKPVNDARSTHNEDERRRTAGKIEPSTKCLECEVPNVCNPGRTRQSYHHPH